MPLQPGKCLSHALLTRCGARTVLRNRGIVPIPVGPAAADRLKAAWDDHFLRRSDARRASDRRLEPISVRNSTDLDEKGL